MGKPFLNCFIIPAYSSCNFSSVFWYPFLRPTFPPLELYFPFPELSLYLMFSLPVSAQVPKTAMKIVKKGCSLPSVLKTDNCSLGNDAPKNMAKLWPRLGYKRKKILHFRSFGVTCKISLVPGTGLEPALLSEHAPETCASTNSATRALLVASTSRDICWYFCAQDKT